MTDRTEDFLSFVRHLRPQTHFSARAEHQRKYQLHTPAPCEQCAGTAAPSFCGLCLLSEGGSICSALAKTLKSTAKLAKRAQQRGMFADDPTAEINEISASIKGYVRFTPLLLNFSELTQRNQGPRRLNAA